MESNHPLQAWLDEHGMSVPQFATEAGLSNNAIYELLRGAHPKFGTVIDVEVATGGAVTIRQMAEYFSKEREHGTVWKRNPVDRDGGKRA